LYDTDETKAVVKRWVSFYKKHRQILDSDVIHLRRPDGNDWDGLLHVNPAASEKGLLMLHNPLDKPIIRDLEIPVYYTGLPDEVRVEDQNGNSKTYAVSRDYHITLPVTIPANGYRFYVMK
jgi:alpha-galactosidase